MTDTTAEQTNTPGTNTGMSRFLKSLGLLRESWVGMIGLFLVLFWVFIAFYTGVFVSFMPFWYIATYLGAVLGTAIPPEVGLDMALPLMFLAMIGPMLRTLAHMAAAFTSLVLGLVFAFLPWNLGLLVAALVALLVGAEIERRMAK